MFTSSHISMSLEKASLLPLPQRIIEQINHLLFELKTDPSFAADELVELAEEILSHVSAVGMAHYLQSKAQKEVYNDFLLQLFTSSGHDQNAGPLYRWAANMIAECTEMRKSDLFRYFWEVKDNKEVLCGKVHNLAELRNRVMHGFFVLPPDENKKQADAIGELLIELHDAAFFQTDAQYHFIQNGQFTGLWNIHNESDWELLKGDSSFGKLVARILNDRSETFWEQELEAINQNDSKAPLPEGFSSFVEANQRGAFACWVHPNDKNSDAIYANMAQWLLKQKDIITLAYTLHDTGISFTSGFLLARLIKLLNSSGKALPSNKKPEDHVQQLRDAYKGKVVVVVNRVHTALFSKQHLTRLNNFLFENNILLVAVGQHYEHFNPFFNQTITLPHATAIPEANQRAEILHNYLRFKGPYADKNEDREDVKILQQILDKLCDTLKNGVEIYARRFADDNAYDMEYVHEIFALLHPWVKQYRKPFEEDTIDELYGFPTNITETTPIYLALGRRDVKLEYQHKVISL